MVKVFRENLPSGKKYIAIDGYLNTLYDVYRDAVRNHNTSVVILIDGKSGRGKTTLANQSAMVLDETFNISRLYYNPTDFLEGLASAKPYTAHVFDEAMIISNRSAMSELNRMIIIAMSMIRSKKLSIIFCVNSIFDLDRNLVLHRADLLLHVYSESIIDKGRFCAFFQAKDGFDRLKGLYIAGKKYYNYNHPKANFYGSFNAEFVIDEQEYEKRKQEGVNKFLLGKKSKIIRGVRQRNICIYWLHEDLGIPVKDIASRIKLSERETQQIIKEFPDKRDL